MKGRDQGQAPESRPLHENAVGIKIPADYSFTVVGFEAPSYLLSIWARWSLPE